MEEQGVLTADGKPWAPPQNEKPPAEYPECEGTNIRKTFGTRVCMTCGHEEGRDGKR